MKRFAMLALLLSVGACSRRDDRVVLVPIGRVPQSVLQHLQDGMPPIVKQDVIVAPPIPLPLTAVDSRRSQFLGDALLSELKRRHARDGDRVIGVIDADVYARGLNFVFGQAEKPGRFAIVALTRFRNGSERQLRDRALKVAVHELGHTRGYSHCEEPTCVMRFANTVGDLDRTGLEYCWKERIRSHFLR